MLAGMPRSSPARLLLFVALALPACGKRDSAPEKLPSGSAATPTPLPRPPATGTVQLFVDEQPVGTVTVEQVQGWPRLDSLLPATARRYGTWQAIEMVAGGQRATILQPATAHPDRVPALFPGERGPAFGLFDPLALASKGAPAVRHDAIAEVRVVLAKGGGRGENEHQGDQAGGAPAPLQLTITTRSGKQVIDSARLLAMPHDEPPGDSEARGWKLTTVLAQAGVTRYERVLLTDVGGVSLTLEKQDFDAATSVPFLKLNRQGQLRLRVFRRQGETWQPTGDLRGVNSVEVLQ